MTLRFRNTLTREKEEFQPIDPGKVRLYTCGPTVYGFAHIGNFRTFMFEDLLRRYLKFKGFEVMHVMNLTDVDDKTIANSQKEGVSLREFTARYTAAFFEDLDTLGIERAEVYPAATDHVPEMVAIIKDLIARGLAYEIGGNWYYRIQHFPEYGKLAHIDKDNLKAGARIAADEYEKDSVSDFALWKAWDEADGDVFWETELGKGRPGWHIECSAMSMKYLGDHFDIHTGGVDNIFPHHENEIAQSEGATGHPFVNYWLHAEHLIVEGRKMAKSFGNFYLLRDLLAKGYTGAQVRYVLLTTHYRQQLNFTFQGLDAARHALERYHDFIANLESYGGGDGSGGEADQVITRMLAGFGESLDDDLNVSGAMGSVFDFIRDINRLRSDNRLSVAERDQALAAIRRVDTVLNLTYERQAEEAVSVDILALVEQRQAARKSRDFKTADEIRDKLLAEGYLLEDTPQGAKVKRK